jgi:hypothetical protein
VVLVGLNEVEVSAFALSEAVLTVKLELSSDNRVLTPAVKRERSLREDKSASIRNTGVEVRSSSVSTRGKIGSIISGGDTSSSRVHGPPVIRGDVNSTSIVEET